MESPKKQKRARHFSISEKLDIIHKIEDLIATTGTPIQNILKKEFGLYPSTYYGWLKKLKPTQTKQPTPSPIESVKPKRAYNKKQTPELLTVQIPENQMVVLMGNSQDIRFALEKLSQIGAR